MIENKLIHKTIRARKKQYEAMVGIWLRRLGYRKTPKEIVKYEKKLKRMTDLYYKLRLREDNQSKLGDS